MLLPLCTKPLPEASIEQATNQLRSKRRRIICDQQLRATFDNIAFARDAGRHHWPARSPGLKQLAAQAASQAQRQCNHSGHGKRAREIGNEARD